jgi:hypothetical protein
LASDKEKPIEIKVPELVRLNRAAMIEVTERLSSPVPFASLEDDAGADAEIEAGFLRKLSGLRCLPRSERIAALRAARLWRSLELKRLREKRATDRLARYMLWRAQLPRPKHP